MTSEVSWLPVPLVGCDRYEVSTDGRVRHTTTHEEKHYSTSSGYRVVSLGRGHTHGIHRLMALAFLSNTDNRPEVDHIDRDKTNNTVANLRWATKSENNTNRLVPPGPSGVRGVSWVSRRGKWEASIGVGGKKRWLGYYDTVEGAKAAYIVAADASGLSAWVCDH